MQETDTSLAYYRNYYAHYNRRSALYIGSFVVVRDTDMLFV